MREDTPSLAKTCFRCVSKNLYVREEALVRVLDEWIGHVFDPENLDATGKALMAVQEGPWVEFDGQVDAARATTAECDQRLRRLRAAIEAGTDPDLVGRWIADVQRERANAESLHHGLVYLLRR